MNNDTSEGFDGGEPTRGTVLRDSRPICIAGMHRSGTSMAARLLHLAGLDLGPEEDLSPPKPENADGFWENVRFVEINECLLEANGGSWDSVVPVGNESVQGVLGSRAALIAASFRNSESWGWKDPRNSLTLRFWREIFPRLRLVVCVRNPLEVAISLSRRNQISYEASLKLWLEYNRHVLAASSASERLVVHYDAFFYQSGREVARLLDFANLPRQNSDSLEGAIRSGLRHSRLTIENLSSAEVRREIVEVYLELCGEAGWLDSTRIVSGGDETFEERIEAVARAFATGGSGAQALLNRAALERDIYRADAARLEEEKKHMQAQRDWHSADRDKLAGIIEQNAAGAAVQQATIKELQSRIHALENGNPDVQSRGTTKGRLSRAGDWLYGRYRTRRRVSNRAEQESFTRS